MEKDAKEEILLDLNQIAHEFETEYLDLGFYDISPDQNIMAYSIDVDGDEYYEMYFKDLKSGKIIAEYISRDECLDTSFEFGTDSRTIIFVTCDEAHRPYKVYRKTLNVEEQVENIEDCKRISLENECEMVYCDMNEKFNVAAYKTLTDEFIFIESISNNTCEYRYLRVDDLPSSEFKLFANRERKEGIELYITHHKDHFYFWHNDEGFVNFKLFKTTVENPDLDNAPEFLPYNPDFYIESLVAFENHLAMFGRSEGVPKLVILDPNGEKQPKEVEFPEPSYDLGESENYIYESNLIRLTYSSFLTPETTYEYNMDTQEFKILKQEKVLGDFDKNNYVQKKLMVPSRDGKAKIPLHILYKKSSINGDIELDGSHPLLLYGYGAYSICNDASFSYSIFSLLDRGVIYAVSSVRGGSELGRDWYLQGKLLNKKNTFYDFIDSAEYLIQQGWTNPGKLAIEGGSAGGLLIGSVLCMRPEIFRAAILEVPFVDLISSMMDPSMPLCCTEYDEWGNPTIKKFYDYMIQYSPYDNIDCEENVNKPFPSILVDHALNDSRVQYWEGLKFVARLRHFQKTHSKPGLILCKTNMKQGHGGAAQRYEGYKELAFRFAFILSQIQ